MPPFASQLERCLVSFDGVSEWADIISFLSRLSRVLNDQEGFPSGIPHKYLLGKRLGQCLNVSLPTGVHSKALEVYTTIFQKLDKRQIPEYLSSVFLGLFSYADACPALMKRSVLTIIEDYVLPVSNETSAHLEVLVLALLSFLEDKSSEFFDIAFHRLTELSKQLSEPVFYTVLINLLLNCGSRRQQIYLMMERISFSSISNLIDPSLLSKALLAGLSDSNLANVRDTLAFLSQNLKLDSSYIDEASWITLVIQAFLTLRFRDSSVIRRLNQWWGVDSQDPPLNPKGLEILKVSLRSAIQTLPNDYLHHLSFILTAFLDNKALAGFIIPSISVDLIFRIYKSPRSNEMACFFDIVELQYIWKPIVNTIFLERNLEVIEALHFTIQLYPLVDDSIDEELVSYVLELTCDPSYLELLKEHKSSFKLLDILFEFRKLGKMTCAFQTPSIKLMGCVSSGLNDIGLLTDAKLHYTSKYLNELQNANIESMEYFEHLVDFGHFYLSIIRSLGCFSYMQILPFCQILRYYQFRSKDRELLEYVWEQTLKRVYTSPYEILHIFCLFYSIVGSNFLHFLSNKFQEFRYSRYITETLLRTVNDDYNIPTPLVFFLLNFDSSNDCCMPLEKCPSFEKNVPLLALLLESCHSAILSKNLALAAQCINLVLFNSDENAWQSSATSNVIVSLLRILKSDGHSLSGATLSDIISITIVYIVFYYDDLDGNTYAHPKFKVSWPSNIDTLLPDLKFRYISMFKNNISRGYASLHLEFYRLATASGSIFPESEDLLSLLRDILECNIENINELITIFADITLEVLNNEDIFEKFTVSVCNLINEHLNSLISIDTCKKIEALSFLVERLCSITFVSSKSISSFIVAVFEVLFDGITHFPFLGPNAEEYKLVASFLNRILAIHPTLFFESIPSVIEFEFKYVDIRVFTVLQQLDISIAPFDGFLPSKPSKYDKSKSILNRFTTIAILSQIEEHRIFLQGAIKIMRTWALEIFSGSKSKPFMYLFFRWIVYSVLVDDDCNMQDVLLTYIENYCQNISRAIDKFQSEESKEQFDTNEIFAASELNDAFLFIQETILSYIEGLFELNSDYEIACSYLLSMLVSPMWRSKSMCWNNIGKFLFTYFPKKRVSKLWRREFWEYFSSLYSPLRSENDMNMLVCECLEIYLAEETLKFDDIFSRSGSISLSIFSNKDNESSAKKDLLGRIGLILHYCSSERLFDQIPMLIGKFQEMLKDDAVRGDVYRNIGILCSRIQMQVLNPFMPTLIMYAVNISL